MKPLPWVSWGPGAALRGLLWVFVVGFFAAPLALIAFDPELESLAARLASQALLGATLIGVALWVAAGSRSGPGLLGALGLRRFRRSAIGWALLAYLGFFVVLVAYSLLVVEPEQEDIARDLGLDEGAFGAIAAGVLIVGVAPFAEELFFRGLLFAGLRRAMPLLLAAAISAALFALPHLPTGPAAVPPLAILGVALAWLYERTGSLWPPILVHAMNNGLAFLATS